MAGFEREIVRLTEQLFADVEVETQTRRRLMPSGGFSPTDSAVRLIHTPSGKAVTCDDYETQIRNQAVGLLRLFHHVREPD